MTVPHSGILIRMCGGLDECDACVRLQSDVWGLQDGDVIPRRSFIVALQIGGQVVGAFDTRLPHTGAEGDARSLIGFAMALPGFAKPAPGEPAGIHPYLHSHMLAVRTEYRNRGIGRRLKLFQREEALSRGIPRMDWTFDPLEIKNAFLNLARLGVIVRRYTPNLYGGSSSRLQGALPTDRLHAEWWLDSQRIRSILEGAPPSLPPIVQTVIVPHEISRWRQTPGEQGLAFDVQAEIRRKFVEAFANGLTAVGFIIDSQGNGVFQLGRWEEPPNSAGEPGR